MPIMSPGIEIMHMPQAVAAEGERIQKLADAVFAGVEGIPPEVGAGRIAIGHDHLGQRGTVHDGPNAASILVTDGVKNETVAHMEAYAKAPFLPAHQIAFYREARAFRLDHLKGFQIRSRRGMDEGGAFGRQRHDAEIIHAHDFPTAQIDDGVQIRDRPRIGVVSGAVADPAMAIGQALAVLLRHAEVPGGPWLDQHIAHVGDAALAAGFYEPRIGLGDLAAEGEFIGNDAGLGSLDMAPVLKLAGFKIGHAVPGFAGAGIVAADERQPGGGLRAQRFLAGLMERNRLKPGAGAQRALLSYNAGGTGDFVRTQGV